MKSYVDSLIARGKGTNFRLPTFKSITKNYDHSFTHFFFFFFLYTGSTFYSRALTVAFDLLKGSSTGRDSSREKVIIFLTDGEPNDTPREIIEKIKTKNAELNNAVVIMTYGMLQDLQILRDIANQDGTAYGVAKAADVTVSTIASNIGSSKAMGYKKVLAKGAKGHNMKSHKVWIHWYI